MAADCAQELRKHNVTCVSLWPGPVRTELITSKMESGFQSDLKETSERQETSEYSGRAIVHLAAG